MLDFLVSNPLLSAIIAFVLILIPAVIVHELGHFLAAKSVGIAVIEFGIGFPPRITKLFKWGETDFTLNWLPIGGFVRPLGEDFVRPISDEAMERDRETLLTDMEGQPPGEAAAVPEPRPTKRLMAVNEAKPLARIFFMSAGALANFISAFVLFVVIGLVGLPQIVGARAYLLEVPASSVFAAAGLKPGDLIEQVNGQRFNTMQDFYTQLDALKGQTATLSILRVKPGDTLRKGEILDVQLSVPADLTAPTKQSFVGVSQIATNSPAEAAGLMPDDLIVAFNGQTLANVDDPTAQLQSLATDHAGQTVILTVLRNGSYKDISLVPRANPPAGEGRIGIHIQPVFKYSLGNLVTFADGPQQQMIVPQPIGTSLQYGFERTADVFSRMAQLPGQLINRTITPEEARPMSIVSISVVGGQFFQQSVEEENPTPILSYIAIINILLGITNLLPIPALDGGRIVFVLIEMVRGRPIAPEREGLVHLIGLALLLALGLIVILNDIITPLPNIIR